MKRESVSNTTPPPPAPHHHHDLNLITDSSVLHTSGTINYWYSAFKYRKINVKFTVWKTTGGERLWHCSRSRTFPLRGFIFPQLQLQAPKGILPCQWFKGEEIIIMITIYRRIWPPKWNLFSSSRGSHPDPGPSQGLTTGTQLPGRCLGTCTRPGGVSLPLPQPQPAPCLPRRPSQLDSCRPRGPRDPRAARAEWRRPRRGARTASSLHLRGVIVPRRRPSANRRPAPPPPTQWALH